MLLIQNHEEHLMNAIFGATTFIQRHWSDFRRIGHPIGAMIGYEFWGLEDKNKVFVEKSN